MEKLFDEKIRTKHDKIIRDPHLATVTLTADPEHNVFKLAVTGNAMKPDHPRAAAFISYASDYIKTMKQEIEKGDKTPAFTLTQTSSMQPFSVTAILMPGASAITKKEVTEAFKAAHEHVVNKLGDPIKVKDIYSEPQPRSRS